MYSGGPQVKQITKAFLVISLTVLIFGYQNCSRTQFNQGSVDTPSLKLASDVGIDPTSVSVAEQPASADDGAKNCESSNASLDNSGLVECEIMSANSKIILSISNTLASGSNAAVSRICMSENACLKLINSYAASRSCKLAPGKPVSDSQTQCAKIFPGSKGTCKNARALSDSDIQNLLNKMAAQ
jgi:hypothetical protein